MTFLVVFLSLVAGSLAIPLGQTEYTQPLVALKTALALDANEQGGLPTSRPLAVSIGGPSIGNLQIPFIGGVIALASPLDGMGIGLRAGLELGAAGLSLAHAGVLEEAAQAQAAVPPARVKRQFTELTVNKSGFYLGGGSNNNLREASQLFDLGGPIANPWINPWTQPLPRASSSARSAALAPGSAGIDTTIIGLKAAGLGVAQAALSSVAAQADTANPTPTQASNAANLNLQLLNQLLNQLTEQQPQQFQSSSFQASSGSSPFTAVFLSNGRPPLFQIGLPSDFPPGSLAGI